MLTVEAMGKKIVTIEGIKNAPVQKSFVENVAFQCGYCTSGFLMVCHSLSKQYPKPDECVIEEWLQSNLCRCTGYDEIKNAVNLIINGDL